MKRENELVAAGWERRFVATEPRLTEAVELYQAIGFDVLLEPLPEKEESEDPACQDKDCTACFEVNRDRYKIIYTRAKDSTEN